MATDKQSIVLTPDAKGKFSLPNVARADITRVDIADVDLLITSKNGEKYLLPGAGLAALGDAPPHAVFTDGDITVDQLISEVGAVINMAIEIPMPSTVKMDGAKEGEKDDAKVDAKTHDNQEAKIKQLQQKVQELEKQQVEQKQQEEHKKDFDQQPVHKSDSSALTVNTEASVEQMVSNLKALEENLHKSDYDYVPPHHFDVPANPVAAPAGVPPPISLTPVVNLYMGNVVGTTTDTATAGLTKLYGGGGASGSDTAAQIGPRDALQFSAATITGTSGNDLIYANGPLVGNSDPTTSRVNNAKEFILNVAGYFTTLNDIQISGVPTSVTIEGATNNGGGNWTLPATTVINNNTFKIIYDMDAWRTSGSNYFDMLVTVSGTSTRGVTFSTEQNFRFEYIDVTDVSQVTDPTLVYEYRGLSRSVYVLPTLAQPSIIDSGEGDDTVYGGLNADTITVGNGNDAVYAGAGNDTVTAGNGTNTIDLGSGNNTLTSGSGVNTVTAADGNNTITVGNGGNSIAVGNGTNTVTTGSGGDTIVVGNGTNSLSDSGGNNTITLGTGTNTVNVTGSGLNTITGVSGNDTVTVVDGGATINLGTGNNSITVNTASSGTDLYTLSTSGSGTNTITAGDGHYIVSTGDGTNTVALGNGTNGYNTQITMGNGTNTLTTGNGRHTVSLGSGANSVTLGSGNDVITAGGGNNTLNAGDGTNSITTGDGNNTVIGGSGDDTVIVGNGANTIKLGMGTNSLTAGTGTNTLDLSDITGVTVSVNLTSSSATGTGLNDTFSGISNVIGNDLGITITGSSGNNTLTGGAGNDTISTGGGNDTVYGLDGNDTITGSTGNDTLYGGGGNNTLYTGTAGTDTLYGGTGNNTFVSQHAGVTYNGTNGAALTTGTSNLVHTYTNGTVYNFYLNAQVNTVDYSASSSGVVLNLLTGLGTSGYASGDSYAFTATGGVSTINAIIGSASGDNLTGSNGDDYLNGGNGNDTLTGGLGTNILVGGNGDNTFVMGLGNDTVVGSVANYDTLYYRNSSAGLVVNLSSSDQTFSKSLFGSYTGTVTVSAYSGTNKGLTANDANSFSNGDTYAPISGTGTYLDQVDGSSNGDVVYAGSSRVVFLSGSGSDLFFGGAANDSYYIRDVGGTDRMDGGSGTDGIIVASWSTSTNYTIYLDGSADINGNSIADYLDRGVTSLTSGGTTYTGFCKFASNGSAVTYFNNFENITTASGNDTIVGDANANTLDAASGTNAIYGLAGNDTIYAYNGTNTIDGGANTDTVNFQTSTLTTGASVFFADATFLGGASDKTTTWGSGFSSYQSRTGSSGTYLYSTITNVENITGSSYDDVLYGDSSANTISGGSGNDIIAGNGGADSLSGGSGNDTFYVTATDLANVTLFDGGTNTDTIRVTGLTSLTAGSISNSKYVSIEAMDLRNSAASNTYGMNANDVTYLADNGTSSSVTLRLDTGDTFTATVGSGTGALSYVLATNTATQQTYYFYSDAGHVSADATNRVAILDVLYG